MRSFATILAVLILLSAHTTAQPVIVDMVTDSGNDTLIVGQPGCIEFYVDANGNNVAAATWPFEVNFSAGNIIGPISEGAEVNPTSAATAVFESISWNTTYGQGTDPDTILYSFIDFGGPLWDFAGIMWSICITPSGTGTIAFDSIVLPANHLSFVDDQASSPLNELPFDWRGDGKQITVAEPVVIADGFTIQGGYAPDDGLSRGSCGGGILIDSGSSPQIISCVLLNNTADHGGGGVYCGHASTALFRDCWFEGNSAVNKFPVSYVGFGGGLRAFESSPSLYNCSFRSNVANMGAGMSCNGSSPRIDSCLFAENDAVLVGIFEALDPGIGGGLQLHNSTAQLAYCSFIRNTAGAARTSPPRGGVGGGLVTVISSLAATNCTFHDNAAIRYNDVVPGWGGAAFCRQSSISLQNCNITNSWDGSAVYCWDTQNPPSISCSNIWNNAGGDWIDCIADQADISGNLSVDPFFCDPEGGDYRIAATSFCAPSNNACGSLIGAHGIGCEGFLVGDVNGNGVLNISDVVYLASYLFMGGASPNPSWTGDTTCDGWITLLDVVVLADHVLRDGPRPECD